MAAKKPPRSRVKTPKPAPRSPGASGGRRGRGSGRGSGGLVIAAIVLGVVGVLVGLVLGGRGDPEVKVPPPASPETPARRSPTPPERGPEPEAPAPGGSSPFLDGKALARLDAHPDAVADYRRAVGFVQGDNARGAAPILQRLRDRFPGEAIEEEIAALQARAAATSDDPGKALEFARAFRSRWPGSRYEAQATVAEAKAHLVLGRRAQKAAGGDDLPAGAARSFDEAARLFEKAASQSADADAAIEALLGRATALSAKGDSQAALTAYQEVARRHRSDPRAATALQSAAQDAWDRDDVETAQSLLGQVVEGWPGSKAANRARTDLAALDVVGKTAPELQVERWFADQPSPLSSLRGKTVMLVFWATWCPHCRKEMPHISELYRRYRAQGLEIVAVTRHSKGQTDADVESYVKENGIPFPVAVDRKGATSQGFGVSGIPAAAIVDPQGKVVWRNHPGRLSDAALAELLPG